MADRELRLKILGDSQSAESALKKVEGATQKLDPASKVANKSLGDLTSTLTGRLGPAGGVAKDALDKVGLGAVESGGLLQTALVGGATAGAAALASMAVKGVGAFADLTGQVRSFQRVSGASAEDASKLVAAAHDLGIDADTAATSVFRLGRNVAEHRDKLEADGVEIAKNKQGNTDLVGTLLNVADAYNHTADQAQKNKLVMDAFGKSGAAMIPILQRGREGLKELFGEAQAHGLIFNDEELQRGKEFSLATKNMGEAFKGVEISLGERIVPLLTDAANLASKIADAGNAKNDKGFIEDAAHWAGVAGEQFDSLFPKVRAGEGLVGKLAVAFGTMDKKTHDSALDASAWADQTVNGANDSEAAIAKLTVTQQEGAKAALDHLFTTGKLTIGQEDLNTALHTAKDGTVDYVAALKDLDPTTAKQVELQARFDAGLGDVRTRFEQASDAADIFKRALDSAFGVQLSADEAARHQADAQRELAKALQESGGSIDKNSEAGNRAGEAFDSLLKSVEDTTEAELRNSNGTMTAAQAKDAFIAKLREEESKFPGLRGQIDAYIATISAIPADKLFTPQVQDHPALDQVSAFNAAADNATRDRLAHLGVQVDPGSLTSVQRLTDALGGLMGYNGATVHVNAAIPGTAGIAAIVAPPGSKPGAATGGYFRARPGGMVVNIAEGGADEIVATKADPAGGARLFHMLYGDIPRMASGGYIRGSDGARATTTATLDMTGVREDIAGLRGDIGGLADAIMALATRPVEFSIDGRKFVGSTIHHHGAAARSYRRSRS